MKTMFIAFTFLIIGCSSQSNTNTFTQEQIDYFTKIALGTEFGEQTPVIKKWTENIRIKVGGEP